MHIKLSRNVKLTLSILFIFIGSALILYTYFSGIKKNLFNEKNLEYIEYIADSYSNLVEETVNEEEIIDEEEVTNITTTNVTVTSTTTTKKVVTNNYIGYLEIDDINLKRGFVDINSKYNKINYNIKILKGSDMPDINMGNFILAAHNGNSSVSFFNKLYKLKRGAIARISYNNKTYEYKLVSSYTDTKDGTLTIRRNAYRNTLTLITCTKGDESTQTIFIFELKGVK